MDFRLSDEQELILESVDAFIDECKENGFDDAYFNDCYEKCEQPTANNKALIDSGLGVLGVPERYGGAEVDLLTMILVAERFSIRDYPHLLGLALQVDDMLTFGNEEQLKIVSEGFQQGNRTFCLGFSEPQAGSDNNMITTSAVHRDGKVIINGHKTFISNANVTPYMLCMAREEQPDDPKFWASMYFVPMNSAGVTKRQLHKVGGNMDTLYEVYLENVEVPESALIGSKGKGFVQLMKNFEIERLVIAANALGAAQCAYDEAVTYANQRVAFGKTLGQFQLIQEMVTENQIRLMNMRNLVYQCAWEKDNGISVRIHSGLAKYYCAREGFKVCDDAMQMMGGLGYTTDCRISRLWRDVRMYRIGGGTDQIMIHSTSREILKQYK